MQINISNAEKMRVNNIRINGDIVDENGLEIVRGAGVEISAATLENLGPDVAQALADAACAGKNNTEEA